MTRSREKTGECRSTGRRIPCAAKRKGCMRMGLACGLLGHKWSNCRCQRCGLRRTVNHQWNGCRCALCGWRRDSDHIWDGCVCSVCGKKRDEGHAWRGCKCDRCGMTRDEGHDWLGCKCKRCGKTRDEGHSFVFSRTEINDDYCHVSLKIYRCSICGRERADRTELGEPQAF